MRLLAKRPADRQQSADDVLRELDAIAITGGTGLTAAPMIPSRAFWRRPRPLLATAALIVLVAVGELAVRARRPDRSPNAGAPGAAQASIAVLPFVNMSGDKDNEYFSDGLTEELIDRLANIRGLHVAARTSSFAFKGKETDVREIGRQLGVRSLVEGSVRRAGSKIRVTAQLIDADSGYHRWSHTYDGDVKDVFAVQEQIGTAIAGELKVALAGRDSTALARAPTKDPLAHTLYLQARYLWDKRTGESLQGAITLFERALARDSTYADAWSGMAECYSVIAAYADVSQASVLPKILSAADHALALDSTLASAHSARASALAGSWRWDEAAREFRTAIALNPNYATARQWFSMTLFMTQHQDEALIEARRATELDPLSLVISTNYGQVLYLARRYGDAERELRTTLERDPTFAYAWSTLALVLLQEHRSSEAITAWRRALALEGEHSWAGYLAYLGYAYAVTGQPDSARAILRTLRDPHARRYLSPGTIGLVQLGLGERDSAFASFTRAIDEHDAVVDYGFPADPLFDALRSDPRYPALLKRENLH